MQGVLIVLGVLVVQGVLIVQGIYNSCNVIVLCLMCRSQGAPPRNRRPATRGKGRRLKEEAAGQRRERHR